MQIYASQDSHIMLVLLTSSDMTTLVASMNPLKNSINSLKKFQSDQNLSMIIFLQFPHQKFHAELDSLP